MRECPHGRWGEIALSYGTPPQRATQRIPASENSLRTYKNWRPESPPTRPLRTRLSTALAQRSCAQESSGLAKESCTHGRLWRGGGRRAVLVDGRMGSRLAGSSMGLVSVGSLVRRTHGVCGDEIVEGLVSGRRGARARLAVPSTLGVRWQNRSRFLSGQTKGA